MTKCDDIKYKKRIYISSVNNFNCQISFAFKVQHGQNCYKRIVLLGMEAKIGS